ncbi:hypothetical protein BH20ACT17_BH20ACT17_20730 [soil metagenome]
MSARGVKALEAELGATAPDGLSALTDTQLRSFGDALHEAKARQSEALERAIDQALEFVPRMVRGAARKTLFG